MLRLVLSAAVVILILIRPEDSVAGAQQAMRLWYGSVAPALFPFLALMPMLTGAEACRAYNRLFSGIMGRIFRLPGSAAPAMVIGMISGSPGGAIAVCRIAARDRLKKNDAHRLGLALAGLSPAYLMIGVGCGLYGSAEIGWKLVLIQAAIQLILLFLLQGIRFTGDETIEGDEPVAAGGMRAAVETVLGVCGYMVVFGAVSSVAAGFIGEAAGDALLLAADLPGGLAAIAGRQFPGKMILNCAAIGFGGMCIAAQNMDALRKIGVSWKEYLSVRGIAAALFACSGGILLRDGAPGQIAGLNSMEAYAFSLFFSCAAAVPGLIFLSKNLFLNKIDLR